MKTQLMLNILYRPIYLCNF